MSVSTPLSGKLYLSANSRVIDLSLIANLKPYCDGVICFSTYAASQVRIRMVHFDYGARANFMLQRMGSSPGAEEN